MDITPDSSATCPRPSVSSQTITRALYLITEPIVDMSGERITHPLTFQDPMPPRALAPHPNALAAMENVRRCGTHCNASSYSVVVRSTSRDTAFDHLHNGAAWHL